MRRGTSSRTRRCQLSDSAPDRVSSPRPVVIDLAPQTGERVGETGYPAGYLLGGSAPRLANVRSIRQTGHHERWTHSDARSVTISLHGGRGFGPPLFFTIVRQRNVSLQEFDRLR